MRQLCLASVAQCSRYHIAMRYWPLGRRDLSYPAARLAAAFEKTPSVAFKSPILTTLCRIVPAARSRKNFLISCCPRGDECAGQPAIAHGRSCRRTSTFSTTIISWRMSPGHCCILYAWRRTGRAVLLLVYDLISAVDRRFLRLSSHANVEDAVLHPFTSPQVSRGNALIARH